MCNSIVYNPSYIYIIGLYNVIIHKYIELHLSGLTGMARYPDMQKIRIVGFFSENRLHWQFEVRLSLFTVCTCVLDFTTATDLKF